MNEPYDLATCLASELVKCAAFALFFAFFLMGDMAEIILQERVSGTFRRLLTTPTRRAVLMIGKILPYYVLAVVQILIVLGVSSLLFAFDLGQSPVGLGLVIAAIAAALTGLGMMLATLVRSGTQVGVLPNFLNLAMSVISGAMFPSIRIASLEALTPHYWAIAGFQDLFARNLGVQAVLPEVGALLGMATLFFAIGIWRFKFE